MATQKVEKIAIRSKFLLLGCPQEGFMTVAKRLKLARYACGLTQKEVAEALGFVPSTLLRWERGDRIPRQLDLEALAAIYMVSLPWLELGEGNPPTRTVHRKRAAMQRLGSFQVGSSAEENRKYVEEMARHDLNLRNHADPEGIEKSMPRGSVPPFIATTLLTVVEPREGEAHGPAGSSAPHEGSQTKPEGTFGDLQARIRAFRDDRDWMQFHNPKNMAMAISIEAAELMEHFLWIDSAGSEQRAQERLPAVAEEMADIGIYLLELADNLGIDLIAAMTRKLALNGEKYPVAKAKGNAKKYSEL